MLLNRNDIVVLDTETTGLDENARICEIAIIDGFGKTLLNSLVNPCLPIPQQASSIHGITDEMVKDAPILFDLLPKIRTALNGKVICIYNADYDVRALNQTSFTGFHLPHDCYWNTSKNVFCVMKDYAEFHGELNQYLEYKWQRLTNACEQQNIDISKFTAHRALADSQMTLALMNEYMVIEE